MDTTIYWILAATIRNSTTIIYAIPIFDYEEARKASEKSCKKSKFTLLDATSYSILDPTIRNSTALFKGAIPIFD